MNNDLAMVFGVITCCLAFPALLSAFSESRPPRAAAVLLTLGGGLIVFAVTQQPSGYSFQDIPDAFVRVFAKFFA